MLTDIPEFVHRPVDHLRMNVYCMLCADECVHIEPPKSVHELSFNDYKLKYWYNDNWLHFGRLVDKQKN